MRTLSQISLTAFLMMSVPSGVLGETNIFGTLDELILATGNEIINIWPQASAPGLGVTNDSVVNMFGGQVPWGSELEDNGVLNLLGGTQGHAVYLKGSSTLNFSGGLIVDHIYAWDTSVVNMSGGVLEGWPHIISTFNLTSGDLPDIVYMGESGTLNIFAKSVGIRLGDSSAELTSVGSGTYTKENFIFGLIDKRVSGVDFGSEEHLFFDVTYSDNTTDSFFVINYPGWSGDINVHITSQPSFEIIGSFSEIRKTAEGIAVTYENNLKQQAANTIVCRSDWSLDGEVLSEDTPGVFFDAYSLTIDFTSYKNGAFLQSSDSQPTAYSVGYDALIYNGTTFGSFLCSGSGQVPPVYTLSHEVQPRGLQLSKSMGIPASEYNAPCGQTFDANTRAYVFRVDDPRDIFMDVEGAYYPAIAIPRAFARVLDGQGWPLADAEITVGTCESSLDFGSLNVLACDKEAMRFDLYVEGRFFDPIPIEYFVIYVNSDQDFLVDLSPLFGNPQFDPGSPAEGWLGGGYVVGASDARPLQEYQWYWYGAILYSQWMFKWGGGYSEKDWIPIHPQQGAYFDESGVVLDLSTFSGGIYAEYDPGNPDRAINFWKELVIDIDGIRYNSSTIIPVWNAWSPNLFDLSGYNIVSPSDLYDPVAESFLSSSFFYSFRALSSGICEVNTSQVSDGTTTDITVLKFSQSLNADSLYEMVVCGQETVQFNAVADTIYFIEASFDMEFSPDWQVELDLQALNPLDSLAYKLQMMSLNEGGGPEVFFPALSITGIPGTVFQFRLSEDLVNWDDWLDFTVSPQGEKILDLRAFEKSPLFLQFSHPVQKN